MFEFSNGLREKRIVFKTSTGMRKQLSWVMLSTFGWKQNQYSLGLVDNVLTLDSLFEEV